MPNNGYFDTIFAQNGDLTSVPDAVQNDGSISYNQGYTVNYELPFSDPNRLRIERRKTNQLFHDVTSALQQYQQYGIPPFITSAMNNNVAFSYSKGVKVLYNSIIYESLVDNNTTTPPSSSWIEYNSNIYSGNSGYIYTGNGFGNPATFQQRYPTGSIHMGFNATPFDGMLLLNGDTLGNSASGANKASSNYQNLYIYLWNNINNTYAPVSGGRGASGIADFTANKTLTIPNCSDKSPYGVGALLNSAGATGGSSSSTPSGSVNLSMNSISLSTSNMPAHNHYNGIADDSGDEFVYNKTTADMPGTAFNIFVTDTGNNVKRYQGYTSTSGSSASFTPTGNGSFSGASMNVIQPVFGVYYYIAI